MQSLKPVVRFGYAPFMILGLNGAGYYVIAGGHGYGWLALILATAIGLAFAAERISPCHQSWNKSHGDEPANTLHAVVYEISSINGVLLLPLIAWLVPWQGVWPHHWPLFAQFLAALVFADLAFTMVHYLSHRYPLLWRLHAVHHGVPRMHGFNGLVRHPLHQTLDMIVGMLPLALAGMPADVAVLLGLAISIQLIVQHSNVSYELGPFRNTMSIGAIHHLHHVNWGKDGDCNFGLFTTLWDRMLGTFHPEPPRAIHSDDLGIDEVPRFPTSYWQQLLFPFTYKPGTGVQEFPTGRPAEPRDASDRVEARGEARADARRMHPAE